MIKLGRGGFLTIFVFHCLGKISFYATSYRFLVSWYQSSISPFSFIPIMYYQVIGLTFSTFIVL